MRSAPRRGQGRRLAGSVTVATLAVTMFTAAMPAATADPACLVRNERTGTEGANLQEAIDDASNGDTIDVRGLCVGSFFVGGKSITLRGVSTAARKKAALYGAGIGTVLIVENEATLNVRNLLITHGSSQSGGGIYINLATVILNGSTQVQHNAASISGGGISNNRGTLTLNGSARVNLNSAGDGAGVWNLSATMTMNQTSRVNKNDASGNGGGVYIAGCVFRMNGAATIAGNTAGNDGGGIFDGGVNTISGAVAGGNVRNNDPNDIGP
jgi:hypothetical protein